MSEHSHHVGVRNIRLLRGLLIANILPIAAVLVTYFTWLLPLGYSVGLALIILGLVVAVTNMACIPRVVSLRAPKTATAMLGALGMVLSVGYVVWMAYLLYGIGRFL